MSERTTCDACGARILREGDQVLEYSPTIPVVEGRNHVVLFATGGPDWNMRELVDVLGEVAVIYRRHDCRNPSVYEWLDRMRPEVAR